MWHFQIDKEGSENGSSLLFISSQPITLKQAEGKEAVKFLFKQEMAFRKKSNPHATVDVGSITQFHVPYSSSVEALKLLAASGMLQFKGRPLACDFFGKTVLNFVIDSNQIHTILKAGNQEFPLSECDFICCGPPHWYIKGIVLRLLTTVIAWKDLLQAYKHPEQLTIKQLQSKFEYDEEDPNAPQLIYLGEAPVEKEPLPPMPMLVLSDRVGAFADLIMVYTDMKTKETSRVNYDDPQQKKLIRNIAQERQWERDLLETDYIKKNVGTTHYYCPVDCIPKSLTFLLEIGWQIEDSKGRKVCRLTDSSIRVDTGENSFLIKGKVRYEDHSADISDVVGAFNRRELFVQLGSGAVGLLPQGSPIEELAHSLEDGEIVHDGIQVHRNHFGSLAAAFEGNSSIVCDDSFKEMKEKLLSFEGIQNSPPSNRFLGTLRHYQQEGVSWLSFLYDHHFHGLLADDMGLGKTIQVLAFLSRLSPQAPTLIVLPTSLLFNWKREIETFLPSAKLLIHHGPDRNKSFSSISSDTIILTSYTTLRIDLPLFERQNYECIILDEAQTIKNAQTQTAQTLYKLHGRFRLSLSGTPVENHLGELWAQFRFLIPSLFDSEEKFLSDAAAGSLDPYHWKKIKTRIAPFFLRRKKEEVAKELPEKIEQEILIEMAPEQRKIYEDFLGGFKGNLFKKIQVDGLSKHRMEVFEAILRLRQICCHPLLAYPQAESGQEMASSKLDLLMQDLETVIEEGGKALVYSQFTSMLSLISKRIQSKGWKFSYLDGTSRDREKNVQQFQEDPSTHLFLISLKAGGIGLNLTAADYVFLFDPWWNEATENQAIDRAHRIGRKSTVIAKRYIMIESIEEKMMKLKASKRRLIDNIIDDEFSQINFQLDDLLFLIESD